LIIGQIFTIEQIDRSTENVETDFHSRDVFYASSVKTPFYIHTYVNKPPQSVDFLFAWKNYPTFPKLTLCDMTFISIDGKLYGMLE
jgi:hypothetical protein